MSKNKCELIKDLLPLYADNVCSEESRKAVAEHIADCSECRSDLEKMGRQLAVSAEKDAKVIKAIKKKIRIEKAVIGIVSAVVLIFALYILSLFLSMDSNMDYERYNLSENVWTELDENGDLWLVKNEAAVEAMFAFVTIRDSDGDYIGENGFDKDKKEAYGVTLKHRRILDFAVVSNENDKPERTLLFNINDKTEYKEVFYYDADNDKEYILWERD